MGKSDKRSFYPVSIIACFILAVFLTIGGYLVGAELGLFNSRVFFDSMEKTEYYKNTYEAVKKKSVELGRPLMLPEYVYDDVFDVKQVKNDIQENFKAQLSGISYTIDTSDINSRLNDNINEFARNENIELGEQQKTTIASFVSQIENEYKNYININYITYYTSLRVMYARWFLKIIAVLALLSILAVFIIIKDHKYVHRGIRYITYSTLSAAIMTGVVPMYLYAKGQYRRLGITPAYYYNMLVRVADKSILTFMYIAGVYLLISAGLIILTVILKKKLKEKNSKHRHSHHHTHYEE